MITSLYAGLCGLLLVVLYARVSQRRISNRIGIGSGDDAEMEKRIRAHANLVETAPIALILLYLFEQGGAAPPWVHAFGAVFVLARVSHAQGISASTGRSAGRFYGSVATLLVIAGLSLALVARVALALARQA